MGKTLVLLTILSFNAHAAVWEKPPYRPDENHLPKEEIMMKEAQEERPDKSKIEKEKTSKEQDFEVIDDAMKEENELSQ